MRGVPILKALSPRHLDIIRRLIVGQAPQEISIELGISQSRISVLRDDPLFDAVYREMEHRVTEGFIETRAKAMEILEVAAPDAARLTRDAISGKIDNENVPIPLRLKSAWDCLDRTGNKAVEKKLVGVVDLGKLISDAYTEKHYGKKAKQVVDDAESDDKLATSLMLSPLSNENSIIVTMTVNNAVKDCQNIF